MRPLRTKERRTVRSKGCRCLRVQIILQVIATSRVESGPRLVGLGARGFVKTAPMCSSSAEARLAVSVTPGALKAKNTRACTHLNPRRISMKFSQISVQRDPWFGIHVMVLHHED